MAQAKSKTTSAFDQVDAFSHLYDRGVGLVNGKPSFTADQAADEILRKGLSWGDKNADGKIDLSYSFLTDKPVLLGVPNLNSAPSGVPPVDAMGILMDLLSSASAWSIGFRVRRVD